MEHVVFSAAQGGAGEEFRRVASLEEAVQVVEHLRNDLGILDPTVFALTPVPLAFRTYYRVEVPGSESADVEAEHGQSSLDLAPAELPHAEAELEASESAADDNDYVFDGHSDMDVSGLLPDASAIPASRSDELDRSLGYFAR